MKAASTRAASPSSGFWKRVEAQREAGRTRRQLILDFISWHISEHGWAPTTREIAEAMETNVSTAHGHVRGLVNQGLIIHGGGPRMIRVVGGTIDVKR